MLELKHISWTLPDGTEILNDINLTIETGKMAVITGPNGGGKTSLAKIIAGLEKPDAGQIILDGEEITGMDITQRAKRGVAYAFQQPVRFKGLTVRDILELAGAHLDEDGLCGLLGKVGLCAREYIDREMSGTLSGGESKRIEIASVLAREARLSVFDEPEAGIDLWSFARLVETFEELRAQQAGTLVVISHQERILSIADEIVVIAGGKVQTAGDGQAVLPGLLAEGGAAHCPRGKKVYCHE